MLGKKNGRWYEIIGMEADLSYWDKVINCSFGRSRISDYPEPVSKRQKIGLPIRNKYPFSNTRKEKDES